ncbi:hypothetical protein [Mucilaginibacter aquatilis]|uniref:Uncharacterized protein n=1 Tax=Mucilaginibacter aquatilis TaxID=1517760 RepID=A0A6I4I388_9SPHI|nr:hypothetical protein [Mucilaginibacter aquatilis]MVN89592.1 hypothetical protein [Mucilaginibacter aquatilis]
MIIKDQPIAMQAKIYMYELNNSARENGFKANEGWEVSRATHEEKTELEKKYQLTIWAKVLPEMLAELFITVKSQLILAKTLVADGKKSEMNSVASNDQQYLVAFNPNRLKT